VDSKLIELTTSIVASYVENNNLAANDVPPLIRSVHSALAGVNEPEAAAVETANASPAQIRKSITPDALISFLDGKKYRTLKRHVATHGLTFAEYRERYGLPKDYPSVAPSYSAQRSEMAKALGLGNKGRGRAPAAAAAPPAKAAKAKAGKGK
jgi:predicted transcriptional regulator